jgi:hypothetical protein
LEGGIEMVEAGRKASLVFAQCGEVGQTARLRDFL